MQSFTKLGVSVDVKSLFQELIIRRNSADVNLHCVYFCNNFVDPGLICIIFGSDTPEGNCNNTSIVFPITPIFCAPTVPCNTSNKSD